MVPEFVASLLLDRPNFVEPPKIGHEVAKSHRPSGASVGHLYDALAPDYDRRHARWLRYAGGEAQAAVEGAVRALIGPNTEMLDVGCGTGRFIRRLIDDGLVPHRVTLLDVSGRMLSYSNDLPVTHVKAPMERIPISDGSLDLVTCLWALETIEDRPAAIREILRVLKPGGWACFAFCADKSCCSPMGRILRRSVERLGAGSFLQSDEIITNLSAMRDVAVRQIPCGGPATALLCRRGDTELRQG